MNLKEKKEALNKHAEEHYEETKTEMLTMCSNEYEALDNVRYEMLNEKINEVRDILLRYYPIRTQIIVNKDCWKFVNSEK